MKEVLPSIISEDQSGYPKWRYIGQNIRLLQDISFFTELKQLPCTLLAIDFEKAFNSLNWIFLFKTLKHVNFAPNFINYVKLMYNNIESAVLNNGSTGNYFKLERCVRQSCPLSAYLFIFAIEVIANKIRNDPDIKGIKIDKKEIKISLLADDITLILKDLLSLDNSLKNIKLFQHCSGLKLNIDKTKAKHIGKILNPDNFQHGISWIKTPLEYLHYQRC